MPRSDQPTDLHVTFRAMASTITVEVVSPTPDAEAAVAAVQRMFADVEWACTRFEPSSPLMTANATPERWHELPRECYDALREAARAHDETGGRFDPRVLRTLQSIGYDRTLPFAQGGVSVQAGGDDERRRRSRRRRSVGRRPWTPSFDEERQAVLIGPEPVDLGGIGKGLAVRWAAQLLADRGTAFLVEAGGDCYLGGAGPDGDGWRVAVEDPAGGPDPLAVLALVDQGCATSSVRMRSWRVDGKPVHHLIDPRTGEPGGAGLAAVTVVGPDPAWAEVWSKSLFLAGRTGIRDLAQQHGLAALWVTTEGRVGSTQAMKPTLIWQADR